MAFFGFGKSPEAPAPESGEELPVEDDQEEVGTAVQADEGLADDVIESNVNAVKENLAAIRQEMGFTRASNDEFLELLRNLLDEMDQREDNLRQLYDDRTHKNDGGESKAA